MSIEERTRAEVIKSLIASNNALIALLEEREAEAAEPSTLTLPVITKLEDTLGEQPPAVKARRRKERPAPPPPSPEPLVAPEAEPVVKVADIKPTKPGKTRADLHAALQACITAHGMATAKERLAPYAKMSEVPDDALATVIEALAA